MTPKFKVGDRVVVKDQTSLFHTRTQAFVRNQEGPSSNTAPSG